MRRRGAVQRELTPELGSGIGPLRLKLERVIHTLEWVRIEEFVESSWCCVGWPPHDRGTLASAFVAKAVLGLTMTTALIERLKVDRALRRICLFLMWKRVRDASTFSRAFDEFARAKLAERVYEAMMQEQLGETLIGHISWDGTAIETHARALISRQRLEKYRRNEDRTMIWV